MRRVNIRDHLQLRGYKIFIIHEIYKVNIQSMDTSTCITRIKIFQHVQTVIYVFHILSQLDIVTTNSP